jgi:FkbM family methyltransferase
MPQHLFDTRTQLNYVVWHNDSKLEAIIRHVIETVKPDRWVETGSHMGWTSMWIAKNYPDLPIYTVELDPEYHIKSRENLAPFPHVTCYQGDSPTFLKNMLPMLQHGTTVFWLDAHWLPPVPLRRECEVVAKLDHYVCLIDDFYCWKPDFPGDLFLSAPGPDGDPTYHNDISYVASALGEKYWRSAYEKPQDTKGLGMFIKGVDYQPPPELMKHETLAEFFESRPPIPNPIHPSCPRRDLKTLEYNGRTMVFDGYGQEHIVGGEGPIMRDNFHIQPGEVFIDVGAADSSWTLYALASGASLVYCFEPALSWYRKLLQDLMANDGFLERSRVFLNGLHKEDGMKTIREVFMHISGANTPQTMVPEFYVPIRFLKLDHFLPELPRLDWIKMDIEGGEWFVMEGGEKIIEKFRPNFIIENHNQVPWIGPWMAENKIVEKILDRLKSLGYRTIYEYSHPQTYGRSYIVALR